MSRTNVSHDVLGRAVLDCALDAVICINERGLVTEWNAQAEVIFGWPRAEAIGMPLLNIIPPRYRDDHTRGLKRYLETGEGSILNRRIELNGIRKNGEEFPIELAVAATAFGSSHVFVAFIRDVSDRRTAQLLLEATAAELQLVVDNVPALISYVDRDLVFRRVNRAYEEFFGRSREQITGKTVKAVVGEPSFRHRAALHGVRTAGATSYIRISREKGRRRPP